LVYFEKNILICFPSPCFHAATMGSSETLTSSFITAAEMGGSPIGDNSSVLALVDEPNALLAAGMVPVLKVAMMVLLTLAETGAKSEAQLERSQHRINVVGNYSSRRFDYRSLALLLIIWPIRIEARAMESCEGKSRTTTKGW
jgi:hypothetical protein